MSGPMVAGCVGYIGAPLSTGGMYPGVGEGGTYAPDGGWPAGRAAGLMGSIARS